MTGKRKAPDDKILLILDLDETLIYATENPLSRPPDFQVLGYYVYKRPYLEEFIRGCNQHFTLAIWSSASDDYVEAIVKQIIPSNIALAFVWGRSRCTFCATTHVFNLDHYVDYFNHYNYIKVLKKVTKRGYSLERVLIVDDTPSKAKRNYGNVIYPTEYNGELTDQELPLLLTYLHSLKNIPNVRILEKRNWKAKAALIQNVE